MRRTAQVHCQAAPVESPPALYRVDVEQRHALAHPFCQMACLIRGAGSSFCEARISGLGIWRLDRPPPAFGPDPSVPGASGVTASAVIRRLLLMSFSPMARIRATTVIRWPGASALGPRAHEKNQVVGFGGGSQTICQRWRRPKRGHLLAHMLPRSRWRAWGNSCGIAETRP